MASEVVLLRDIQDGRDKFDARKSYNFSREHEGSAIPIEAHWGLAGAGFVGPWHTAQSFGVGL